ncbi:TPA: YrzI family small protein [Bacillus luti]|nr:YrzI family small protein [Bacillus luti]
MKFHVFFLTITIQKETISQNEIIQEQQYKQIIDEIRDRRSKYYTHL